MIRAKVISICSLIDSHVLAFLWTIGHLCYARVKHLQQSKWYRNIRANIIVVNKVKVILRKIRIGESRSTFELCISFWLTFSREKSKSGALKSSSLWINVTTSFLLSLMEPSPYIADKKGRRPATTFLILTFYSWNNFIISKKPIQENTIGGACNTSMVCKLPTSHFVSACPVCTVCLVCPVCVVCPVCPVFAVCPVCPVFCLYCLINILVYQDQESVHK